MQMLGACNGLALTESKKLYKTVLLCLVINTSPD